MTDPSADEILCSLTPADVGAERREQLRRLAHRMLDESTASSRGRSRTGSLEPVLLLLVGCVHTAWALGMSVDLLLR